MTNEEYANIHFMREAYLEAAEGIREGHGGPFGCIIVKGSTIVGRGHNRVLVDKDPTCHGEIVAIRDACKNLGTYDLSECTLYTTSEPCPMCNGAILWARIPKIYYGCTIRDAEDIGFDDSTFYETRPSSEQICREQCLELFRKYEGIIY